MEYRFLKSGDTIQTDDEILCYGKSSSYDKEWLKVTPAMTGTTIYFNAIHLRRPVKEG
jgi:hypothetical protein